MLHAPSGGRSGEQGHKDSVRVSARAQTCEKVGKENKLAPPPLFFSLSFSEVCRRRLELLVTRGVRTGTNTGTAHHFLPG